MTGLYDSEFAEHLAVAAATRDALREPFGRLVGVCAAAVRAGNKLLFFGNGGSAADAQHLATELVVRYKADRAPIAALALTTDTSALTAAANDLGFEQVFSRQLEALGRAGDVAIGITTSGRSANVVRALGAAKTLGLRTVVLTGGDGGEAARVAELALIVPSAATARIQEMHIALGQMLCAALEIELGLANG
jgi:D-sedoheptulose 7-phosphate isomerase